MKRLAGLGSSAYSGRRFWLRHLILCGPKSAKHLHLGTRTEHNVNLSPYFGTTEAVEFSGILRELCDQSRDGECGT